MSDFKFKPEFKQCFVSHVESDGQSVTFWLQSDVKEVLKFESERDSDLRQLFRQCFQMERKHPLLHKYYIFWDKLTANFYRVFVQSIDLKVNESLVFFIDFGYSQVVSRDCLFVFSPLFVDIRPLAQRYLLSDIRPKDVTKGFDSQKVVKTLHKYLRSVLMFTFFTDNRIKVFDESGEDVFKACLLNDGIEDIVFETNETNGNLFAIGFDNDSLRTTYLTEDFKSLDLLSESNSLSEDKTANKENEISSDLIVLNESNESNDQSIEENVCEEIPIVDKSNGMENPFKTYLKSLLGSKRWIYVTKSDSSKRICVQLKDSWDSCEELNATMNRIYEFAVIENQYPLKLEDIAREMVVAALYYGNWYRASVVDVESEKGLIKVFYIDFGNTETVELKFCRYLRPELRKIIPKAIRCRPLNESLSSNTLEIYETNVQEMECLFQSLNSDNSLDVLLYDNGVLLSGDSVASTPQRPKIEETVERVPKVEKLELREKKLDKKEIKSKQLLEESEAFLSSLIGSEEKVIISKAINSKSIYCQLESNLEQIIGPLVEDMNDFYRDLKDFLTFDQLLDIKEKKTLIAVYSELENQMMRSRVSEVFKDEDNSVTVEVFYVDYGIEERAEQRFCLELDDIHFNCLIQGIHCRPMNEKISYYELKNSESNSKVFSLRFISLDSNNLFITRIS